MAQAGACIPASQPEREIKVIGARGNIVDTSVEFEAASSSARSCGQLATISQIGRIGTTSGSCQVSLSSRVMQLTISPKLRRNQRISLRQRDSAGDPMANKPSVAG
jgi:hypothetical protein